MTLTPGTIIIANGEHWEVCNVLGTRVYVKWRHPDTGADCDQTHSTTYCDYFRIENVQRAPSSIKTRWAKNRLRARLEGQEL